MSRRNIYVLTLTCATLIALFVCLLGILHVVWPGIAWIILGILAAVVLGVITPVLYALVSMEMGYYTEDELSRRMRKQTRHDSHSLKALLHMRTSHR